MPTHVNNKWHSIKVQSLLLENTTSSASALLENILPVQKCKSIAICLHIKTYLIIHDFNQP